MGGLSADDFFETSIEAPEGAELSIAPIGTAPANFGITQALATTKKDYRAAYIYINVTSSSQRRVLEDCSRKYQISKSPEVVAGSGLGLVNIDWVFGHSVGAGVQTYLATRDKQQAHFAAFLAWNADLEASFPKKGKSSVLATLAVDKFIHLWERDFADKWELASFAGKPATELTFMVDTENGYFHAGHIDAVLRNKYTGRYMVLEIKTTAIRAVDEAQFGNQEQALGYSIVLDKIVANLDETQEFHVLYLAYSSTNREYFPLPFTKSRTQRIEWLQDLLLDHAKIGTYRKLNYFPKNGNSCWKFNSRCPHYGICDLKSMRRTDFKVLELKEDFSNLPEKVDFVFKLSDLTAAALRSATVAIQPNIQGTL